MNVLFVFCEGPHDAHFVARLLRSSGIYVDYEKALKEYPEPLGSFIQSKFRNRNIDEIRIGKPDNPLVPVCGLKAVNSENLIFPISLGGMDQSNQTNKLLKEIHNSFAADILERPDFEVKEVSILFIYDADARGIAATIGLWNERYAETATGGIQSVNVWENHSGFRHGLFIFTGHDGDTGTLEDNLIELFRANNETLLNSACEFLGSRFEASAPTADAVAHATKKNKGVLTICGQAEKNIAGYALTVVVRDTKLLENAFDFNNTSAQWTQLLNFINEAFA